MFKLMLRHNFIWILILLLALPLPLTMLTQLFGPRAIFKWMAHDYRLGGMTKPTPKMDFKFSGVTNHEVQHDLEKRWTNQLSLRSLFIRLNNQIYYSFFKKSYLDDHRMVIGKSEQFFEIEYINSYCNRSGRTEEMLIAWADRLKKLNDYFAKKGKVFIYLITPSKAEYSPEFIPNRFHCQKGNVSHHVMKMRQLLTERQVNFIDGTQLMEQGRMKYGVDMFPRGGIHWNTLGATLVANAIIDHLNKQGKNLDAISFDYQMTKDPQGQDRDLVWLLNLLKPDDRYPVPVLKYAKKDDNSSQKLCFIGGSFLEKLIDVFRENKTFSHIVDYRYFKLGQIDVDHDKKPVEVATNLDSKTLLDPLYESDIVILEENAALTVSGHGQLFYTYLLNHQKENQQESS